MFRFTHLDHGSVDVGRTHDLVVVDELVLVDRTENVAARDGLEVEAEVDWGGVGS